MTARAKTSRQASKLTRIKRLGRWSTINSLGREFAWRLRRRREADPASPAPPLTKSHSAVTVTWPSSYRWPPAASWLEPIRLGLGQLVELRHSQLSYQPVRHVVPFEIEIAGRRQAIAVDYGDDVTLDPSLPGDYALVFKMQ